MALPPSADRAPGRARPPKSLLRLAGRAIGDYDMLRDGDRVLVGVSGGKDSLSLLHLLLHLSTYAPVRFEVGAATVDPQIEGFDPSPLVPYLAGLGVPYFYESQPILDQARRHLRNPSFCAFCARMKRGVLYRLARENGYRVLALAQHLDDLAESFLISAFHAGRLQTMKAHYRVDAGDLRVIRPFAYVRERALADFARTAGLPVVPDSCPACYRAPTEREHVKALLAREEAAHPRLFGNLLAALRPLMVQGRALAAGARLPADAAGLDAGPDQGLADLEVGQQELEQHPPAELQRDEQQHRERAGPGPGARLQPRA
jgi:tRNA 2-thiocytidine biosynthesis protein TtcA